MGWLILFPLATSFFFPFALDYVCRLTIFERRKSIAQRIQRVSLTGRDLQLRLNLALYQIRESMLPSLSDPTAEYKLKRILFLSLDTNNLSELYFLCFFFLFENTFIEVYKNSVCKIS